MDFPTVQVMGPTDQAREATITLLKDAYARGALGDDELGHCIHAALTSRDARDLEALLPRTVETTPPAPQSSGWGRARVAVASCLAGVVLLGVGAVWLGSTPAAEEGVCMSTGLTSEMLECPAPTSEQAEIEQRAEIAESAAEQAAALAGEASSGAEVQGAADAARAASGRAQQVVGRAQMIMADSLGQDPPAGAFDQLLDDARAAAKEALQALNDAEAAATG